MKRFKFKLKNDYGRRGPRFYYSRLIQYRRDFERCKAEIESRVNGPKTAFARITFYNMFYTTENFGFSMYRHFSGNNCFKQAEAWCNWLLNNYPCGYAKVHEKKQKAGK